MPVFESPDPLRELAMKVLTDFFVGLCNKCITHRDYDLLRMCVAYIKDDLGPPRIPCLLAADIYSEILERFLRCRERIVYEITKELIIDRKIVGLRCSSRFLDILNFNELRRIEGLWELTLHTRLVDMAGLHLGDIRKLIYNRGKCTDSDLKVIGRDCSKLENLDISFSSKLTDAGLRYLNPCTNLSSLNASYCPAISLSGINDLLSANNKIRKLSAWEGYRHRGFDCFSNSDNASVHPSIESFVIAPYISKNLTDDHLQLMVVKFPNLKSLKIIGYRVGDLSVLGALSQLEKLKLYCHSDSRIWYNLQPGLRSIGSTVRRLEFNFSGSLGELQGILNSIFEFCGNVKKLSISYRARYNRGVLLIPPFRKLESLVFHNLVESSYEVLEFGRMLELEYLRIGGSRMTTETMESFVLAKTEYYPNLRTLVLEGSPSSRCDMKRIEDIVEDNNLDLWIDYPKPQPRMPS